jgi:hypothetical protein
MCCTLAMSLKRCLYREHIFFGDAGKKSFFRNQVSDFVRPLTRTCSVQEEDVQAYRIVMMPQLSRSCEWMQKTVKYRILYYILEGKKSWKRCWSLVLYTYAAPTYLMYTVITDSPVKAPVDFLPGTSKVAPSTPRPLHTSSF